MTILVTGGAGHIGSHTCAELLNQDYQVAAANLARGHVAAHDGCEVFNPGTGTGCSVLDQVKTFRKVSGVPVSHQIVDRRPGDIAACYAAPGKNRDVLGRQAEKNPEDMCRDTRHWQKNKPAGYGV